jgi:purine catabolism regulator
VAVLTVRDVLAVPEVRAAGPELRAGVDGLDREVRWVHSAELADIAPLLRGGDLLLSTGIALPDTASELREFAVSLHHGGAAGLMIELGRRWSTMPASLVDSCDTLGLPLVALTREVRFAAVAQAVGERVVDEQVEELRQAQRVHDTFTELSIAEAGPEQVLETVQRLAGAAVVLENEQHQVLDYRAGPEDVGSLLGDWTRRSRLVALDGRTSWDRDAGWLLTRVGRADRGWGRLIVTSSTAPSQRLVAIVERGAAAMALHRLHDRHRDSAVRRVHHELLTGLIADPHDPGTQRRCEVAGVPLERRQLVGLCFRVVMDTGDRSAGSDEVVAAVVQSAHQVRAPALVCEVDTDIRALVSLPVTAHADRVVDQLAAQVARRHAVVIGVGRTAKRVADVDRTLREAYQVAQVASPTGARGVHRLADVHLRGLLALLADDDRVRLFAARELDALTEYDDEHGTHLLDAVRALLRHPESKTAAASSLHISRPVLYDRLAKAEQVLGADLSNPDAQVSLHVALLSSALA